MRGRVTASDPVPATAAVPATGSAGATRSLALPVRVIGAGLLLATGGIHLYLWATGYRDVQWIGPLFMANVVLCALGAAALLAAPRRLLPWVALLGGLLEIGTLGGLLLSLTVGLFGFSESWSGPIIVPTLVVEAAGFLLLGAFSARELGRTLRGSGHRGRRV